VRGHCAHWGLGYGQNGGHHDVWWVCGGCTRCMGGVYFDVGGGGGYQGTGVMDP
jgi:hypothetical protein